MVRQELDSSLQNHRELSPFQGPVLSQPRDPEAEPQGYVMALHDWLNRARTCLPVTLQLETVGPRGGAGGALGFGGKGVC